MTDFNDFKKRVVSKKIYLAEVWTGIHLQDWTKTSGYTYVYELPVLQVPFLNHLPIFQEVIENDTAYTAKISIAQVESAAGSYFYDKPNKKIYIHTTGSDDPDGTTEAIYNYTIVANFWLRFGSSPKTFNKHYYYPRISENGLNDLTVSSRTIFFGIQTTGNGILRLVNTDKFFDQLLKRYIWANREITIKLGGDEMVYDNYIIVFKGNILDWQGNDQEITLTVKDYRSLLLKKIPPNIYEQDTYPNLNANNVGNVIPIGYGYLTSAPCIKINTTPGKGTFKIVDHPITKLYKVYNDGAEIPSSYITSDLANGQFSISNGYTPTIGTITADFIGYPLSESEEIYYDDFSDNDISDWDSFGTGTWTASDEKVRGTTSGTSRTELIHGTKLFSAGYIEVKINIPSSLYTANERVGIVWDFVDHSNWFGLLLFVNGASSKIRIVQCAGTISNLTNITVTINPDTDYILKLTLSASGEAKGYIDGVEKTTYTFTTAFYPQKIGLLQSDAGGADYDDFSLGADYICCGAQIVRSICSDWLLISSEDIDADSFADSLIKAGQILACYIGSQEDSANVIERVCHSNICRFVIGENGKVFYSFWSSEDTLLETIEPEEILGDYQAEEKESEIYDSCLVKYGQGCGTQVKIKTWSDPRVQYLYGRNQSQTFETYLQVDEDASELVYRFFRLLQAPVTRYRFKTKMKTLNSMIGDVIHLKRKRGISIAGQHNTDFRIVALTKDFSKAEVTVEAVADSAALGEAFCEVTCQQACELACQTSCQLHCQEICQLHCEGNCQISCMFTCEQHCQTNCQLHPECESSCKSGCEGSCQNPCTSTCESVCQDTCQLSCQSACEMGCQFICELGCRTYCEMTCQEVSLG